MENARSPAWVEKVSISNEGEGERYAGRPRPFLFRPGLSLGDHRLIGSNHRFPERGDGQHGKSASDGYDSLFPDGRALLLWSPCRLPSESHRRSVCWVRCLHLRDNPCERYPPGQTDGVACPLP